MSEITPDRVLQVIRSIPLSYVDLYSIKRKVYNEEFQNMSIKEVAREVDQCIDQLVKDGHIKIEQGEIPMSKKKRDVLVPIKMEEPTEDKSTSDSSELSIIVEDIQKKLHFLCGIDDSLSLIVNTIRGIELDTGSGQAEGMPLGHIPKIKYLMDEAQQRIMSIENYVEDLRTLVG